MSESESGSGSGSAAGSESAAGDETARPALRIVSGNPSAEDVAVLTALLAAAANGGGGGPEPARRGGWRDPARLRRRQLFPGPGAWRSSGW